MSKPSKDGADTMSNAQAPALSASEVAAYLAQHPDFLNANPDVLKLLQPPTQWDGGNVVDLQTKMVERLRQESQELKDAANLLIATTRANMLIQTRTHAGVMAMLAADGFDRLMHVIVYDLPLLLDVDAVSLCFETADNGQSVTSHPDVRWLAPGTVDKVMGGPDKYNKLVENALDDGSVFGEVAGIVHSAALTRLSPGNGVPAGLLALGARETGTFHSGQASDLLVFMARVAETCLNRWLPTAG